MARTPNYGWPLTPQSEEKSTTVEEWTRRLTDDTDDSVLMQIDRLLSRVSEAVKWNNYAGENLSSLEVLCSRNKEDSLFPDAENRLMLLPANSAQVMENDTGVVHNPLNVLLERMVMYIESGDEAKLSAADGTWPGLRNSADSLAMVKGNGNLSFRRLATGTHYAGLTVSTQAKKKIIFMANTAKNTSYYDAATGSLNLTWYQVQLYLLNCPITTAIPIPDAGTAQATVEELIAAAKIDRDTWLPSWLHASIFFPASYNYSAKAPFSGQYLTIQASGAGLVNQELTIKYGGSVVATTPLPVTYPVLLNAGDAAPVLEAILHPVGETEGSELYEKYARTYTISISRASTEHLFNMYVTPDEDAASTYKKIWSVDDLSSPLANYEAGTIDDGSHAIYQGAKSNYGVMVGALETYIHLNVEAIGTSEDGATNATNSYLIISEYGAKIPQVIDSRTYVNENASNNGEGRMTDVRLRLDPSKNGTQVFQVTVVNQADNTEGTYYLTVYRDEADDPTKLILQTWLKGNVSTASKNKPDPSSPTGYRNDFEATYTLYRRHEELKMMTVDTAAEKFLGMTAADSTYTQRWEALQKATGSDGLPLLTPVTDASGNLVTGITDKDTGAFEIGPDQIGQAGSYLLHFQRPGYLDYTLDNLLVYRTWAEAEYDFGKFAMRPGDLDHNGVIDIIDEDIFHKYVPENMDVPSPSITSDGFDLSIVDFDGNGYLNSGDLGYMLAYRGMTANGACYWDNPNDYFEVYLQHRTTNSEQTEV